MMAKPAWTSDLLRAAGVLGVLALTGCSSTRLVSSWSDSEAGTLSFQKVVVVCMTSDPVDRRAGEDALAGHIVRAEAVPSYTFISDEDLQDEPKVEAMVVAAGFDGMLTLRMVSREEKQTWVEGASNPGYYHDYRSYHRRGWGGVYSSGYTRVDEVVQAEILIYTVKDMKLVWAATSETLNPTSLEQGLGEVAAEVAKDLRKRGLVPPEKD